MEFADNRLAQLLYGAHDRNLARLESLLDIELSPRGNRLTLRGSQGARQRATVVLNRLYQSLGNGSGLNQGDIDAAVRFTEEDRVVSTGGGVTIKTPRRVIEPRTPMQAQYLEALKSHDCVFALGPAGTGKTYLAVAAGVQLLIAEEVDRLILSRPAVEAGERLGFLPGDMREKVDPYLRPLYDALHDMLPAELVQRKLESGEIEVAPLAFMRGRTLAHAYAILDEAQNATPVQMKMFLTRLGEHARMVVTGDPTQIDLPSGQCSGLLDAVDVLRDVDEIAQIRFTERDVVRHPLVTRIVSAYNDRDTARARDASDQGSAPLPPPRGHHRA